jgi:CheY-like chemotaxis protein
VYLPVGVAAASAPPSSRWDDIDVRGEGEHVLVVEDDRRLRHLVTELVRGLGYDVKSAGSAAEALAIVNGGAPVDLLLADVVLGGTMSGQELAHVVRERRPGVVVVCMTGYGADELRARGTVDAGVTVLEKPFHVQALAKALRRALLRAA